MPVLSRSARRVANRRQRRGAQLLAAALAFTTIAQAADSPANTSYYVEAGSYGSQRESEPPAYVRNIGTRLGNAPSWLDAGLQYRLRYEHRDDDLRRLTPNDFDSPLLTRTRLYVGIKEVLDPLRLVVELTDSRRRGSHHPQDNRDVNELDFIQARAELHYPALLPADPRGNARPLRFSAGRMAFEALDRRLIARNEWRNTTNALDGLLVNIGDDHNDWALELMRFYPVTRLMNSLDRPNRDIVMNTVIGHYRALSPALTLEPYFFQLRQHASAANGNVKRTVHAPGLRVYGRLAGNRVNYDLSAMQQYGSDAGRKMDASAYTAEIGYSFLQHPWQPRLSASYGYASGDRNPFDGEHNRFERFFGFARPWSSDDYIIFENVRAPKIRLDLQPLPGLRMDMGYNKFRLASRTDRLSNLLDGNAGNRDITGNSGDDIGHSWDIRLRFNLGAHLQANIGYSSFQLDDFPKARQRTTTGEHADDSDFTYLELTYRLFE